MLDSIFSGIFCVISGLVLIFTEGIFSFSGFLWPLAGWGIWLASGCLAATAAELLNRPILPHFLLGLLVPYVYPVWFIRHAHYVEEQNKIKAVKAEQQAAEERKNSLAERFQAMQEKREQERAARLGTAPESVSAATAAGPSAEPDVVPETAVQTLPEPASGNEIHDLLYEQPVNAEGCRPGPFQFTLKDGTQIDIDGIRSLAPDHMICILTATGKSVRLRYAQVDSVARYETECKN